MSNTQTAKTALNNWRQHRNERRTKRAIAAAMAKAPTPGARDELVLMANRLNF